MDDLPVGEKKIQVNPNGSQLMIFDQGFPLGAVEGLGKVAYIHNHVSIKILYHVSADFVGRRIVGFEVEPKRSFFFSYLIIYKWFYYLFIIYLLLYHLISIYCYFYQ